MNKDIDKEVQRAFRLAGFHAGGRGRIRGDIEFKRKSAIYMRENGKTLEEIKIALGYKSISGVQRILKLIKQYAKKTIK
jgi:hypothetical protein